MPLAFGHDSYMGVSKEVTYGTNGGTPTQANTFHVPAGGDSYDVVYEKIEASAVGLLGPAHEHLGTGKIDPKGSFQIEMPYQGAEYLLWAAFGFPVVGTVVDAGNDFATHTFQINDQGYNPGVAEGLSLYIQRGKENNSTFQFTGTRVNKMELSCQKDGFLMANFECVSQQVTQGNAFVTGGATLPDPKGLFNFVEGVVQFNDGSLKTVPCRDMRLTLDNALETDRFLAGLNLRQAPERGGKLSATAKFTFDFEDLDLWNLFKTQNLFQFITKFTSTTSIPTSSPDTKYSIEIRGGHTGQNQARVRQLPLHIGDEGIITAELEMKFYRNAAETNRELQVVLVNGRLAVT